jgi:energy-converting hydrogenase Eha subunit B
MQKLNPRRIAAKPGLIGVLGATALLAACFVFPEEVLGFRTPYFFSGIVIAGCFLWAALRKR